MRHEAALKYLDELDARQEHSLALRLHLARCPSCASAALKTRTALRAYRAPEASAPDAHASELTSLVEDRVMAAVRLMPPPRQDFALRDWLFPGVIIAVSMVLVPFLGKDIGFLETLFGSSYALSFSLVLGVAFTAYCALFIATHLGELQLYLEKRGLMPR
jgi:hypothetical protein